MTRLDSQHRPASIVGLESIVETKGDAQPLRKTGPVQLFPLRQNRYDMAGRKQSWLSL